MIYELTIIAPEKITDAGIDSLVRVIKRHTTGIQKFEDDGVKRLAYSIQGQDKGRYLYWQLGLPSGEPQKLSSELNINDNALRYLLVKADTRYA